MGTKEQLSIETQPSTRKMPIKGMYEPVLGHSNRASCEADELLSSTGRPADDAISDFVTRGRNLLGRIGTFKINFSKNLQRFKEVTAEKAFAEPKLTQIASLLFCETLLPSSWSLSQQKNTSLTEQGIDNLHS